MMGVSMGVQDRDWWRERDDDLHGRKRMRKSVSVSTEAHVKICRPSWWRRHRHEVISMVVAGIVYLVIHKLLRSW